MENLSVGTIGERMDGELMESMKGSWDSKEHSF